MRSLSSSGRRGIYGDPLQTLFNEMERMLSSGGTGLSSSLGRGRQQQGQTNEIYVPIDLEERPDSYVLTAEIPGVRESDLEVNVSGNLLTIRGTKPRTLGSTDSELSGATGSQTGSTQGQQNQQGQGQGRQGQGQQMYGTYGQRTGHHTLISERETGHFMRSFELPSGVDPNNIQAECNRGLLQLTVRKTAEGQRQQRRIEVRSGQNG